MKISQLLHSMDKDDEIIINDEFKPINRMQIFRGKVREIKRNDPVNHVHVNLCFACDDTMVVLVGEARAKGIADEKN